MNTGNNLVATSGIASSVFRAGRDDARWGTDRAGKRYALEAHSVEVTVAGYTFEVAVCTGDTEQVVESIICSIVRAYDEAARSKHVEFSAPGKATSVDSAAHRHGTVVEDNYARTIHDYFCARTFGPVETLVRHSTGEVTIYLPSPPPGSQERISEAVRYWVRELPASMLFRVYVRASVDRKALATTTDYTLIEGPHSHAIVPVHKHKVGSDLIIVPANVASSGTRWEMGLTTVDMRRLDDAIGRALEVGHAEERVTCGLVRLVLDELLISPAVVCAEGVNISADTKHLRLLRQTIKEAAEKGTATCSPWGKEQTITISRLEVGIDMSKAP